MDQEGESGALTDTLHKAVDGVGGERPAALRLEREGALRIPLQFAPYTTLRFPAISAALGWPCLPHALNAAQHYPVEVEARKFALECWRSSWGCQPHDLFVEAIDL